MKKEYLLKSKVLYNLYLFYISIKYKYFLKKNSYSQFGEDKVIDGLFGNFVGTYVDIGCFHPIKYSNTALLHKKGWKGINVDINKTTIDFFNVCRKNDTNIVACLSDKIEDVELYIDSEFSALNSANMDNIKKFGIKKFSRKKVKTQLFNILIKKNFDFLNIDCEGNDLKILKTIDLGKYTPKVINIEVFENDKNKIYNYLNHYGYKIYEIKSLSHIFVKKI